MESTALDAIDRMMANNKLTKPEQSEAIVHPAYVGQLPGTRSISPSQCERNRHYCKAIREKLAQCRNNEAAAKRERAEAAKADSENKFKDTMAKILRMNARLNAFGGES